MKLFNTQNGNLLFVQLYMPYIMGASLSEPHTSDSDSACTSLWYVRLNTSEYKILLHITYAPLITCVLSTSHVDEREARLQQMRDGLAAESVEEKEVRSQQMRGSQRERLAAETAEEREARLQQKRSSQVESQTSC